MISRVLMASVAVALIAAASAAAAPTASVQTARPLRVAVLETRSTGEIPPRALAALNQSLVPELRKLDGVSVLASSELADLLGLERQKQLLGCSEETSCLAEIAGALDSDELITVELTLVGDSYALTLRRMDLRKARVLQTWLKQFEKRDGEELLGIIGPAIQGLYPERALKPGRQRGVEAELVRRLNPPPLPRWVFFGTSAAAVVAGGVGVLFLAQSLEAGRDFQARAAASVNGATVEGTELVRLEERAHSQWRLATAVLSTAAALAAAALIETFFTDWRDDRVGVGVAFLSDGAAALWTVRF